ncbi:MAG TPA: Asp-tRNA(Asn)/Glu-tRNA(Gln) amidotransferase subunit GatC [Gemmatimonadales bacterium]|nr:Asp-tRNA(Asn)/Glu-tRNA(Gln) amidotransferase subunit GatC [Gemmatimonadales bacterium]
MTIGRDEVLHVARLAELAVRDGEVDRLVEQMNRIVDYVAQLDEVSADDQAAPLLPGPVQVPLRADTPGSVPLARPPAAMAPEFADGFFLVPRHGAMEEL